MFAPIASLWKRQQTTAADVQLEVQDSGLTAEQIESGQEALQLLGFADHADCLSRHECMDVLFAVGLNPTLDVLDSKLRQLNLHRHTTLSWGELAHVWRLFTVDAVDEEHILQQAFSFFDKDGNKEVSIAELTTTMHELGDLLTAQEIKDFVTIMDKNEDGVVAYEEFLIALRNKMPLSAPARQKAGLEANIVDEGASTAVAESESP